MSKTTQTRRYNSIIRGKGDSSKTKPSDGLPPSHALVETPSEFGAVRRPLHIRQQEAAWLDTEEFYDRFSRRRGLVRDADLAELDEYRRAA